MVAGSMSVYSGLQANYRPLGSQPALDSCANLPERSLKVGIG